MDKWFYNYFFVFPESLSETVAFLLIICSFFTSLVSALFGLGGGVILLAIFAVSLEPIAIIPVHGVVQAASNVGRLLTLLRKIYTPVIIPFLMGCFVGAAFGGATFSKISQVNPELIQMLVGIFIMLNIFQAIPAINIRHITLIGAISSFLTILVGGAGSFVAAVVTSLRLEKLSHIATIAFMLLSQHFMKVIVFGFLGFSFSPYISLIVCMIITGFLGTLVGRVLVIGLNENLFRRILNVMLFFLALKLIITPIWGSL